MNLLRSVNSWLQNQTGDEISYEALKKILDNSALVSRDRAVQTNIHLIIAMKLGRLVHSCWSSQHCNYSALTFCLSFIFCIHCIQNSLPITYCIEEVHKCKFVTFVSLSTQAFREKGRERRGNQTDKQLQGEQRAGHRKMHPDWCEDVCLGVALSFHWVTKVTCQSGHLISSKPPQRHQSDA